MKIVRYARARVLEKYELEVDEALVKQLNEDIKRYEPNFVNLTLEDLIIFIKNEEDHPRLMEEISGFYDKETLGDYICDYIYDELWCNYCGIIDSDTYDWDDEYVED